MPAVGAFTLLLYSDIQRHRQWWCLITKDRGDDMQRARNKHYMKITEAFGEKVIWSLLFDNT